MLLNCCLSPVGKRRRRWSHWTERTKRITGLNQIFNSRCNKNVNQKLEPLELIVIRCNLQSFRGARETLSHPYWIQLIRCLQFQPSKRSLASTLAGKFLSFFFFVFRNFIVPSHNILSYIYLLIHLPSSGWLNF